MMGVAPVSTGLRAVTGSGRVSAPAAVMTGVGGGAGGVGVGGGGLAAASRRSLSCLSGAWTVQMSIKNFIPKKQTHRKARNAVEIKGKKAESTSMLTTINPVHTQPSPIAIIATV